MDGITTAIVRTTLCTILAAGIAKSLLVWRQVHSTRVHRLVWTLVLVQGWLLFPFIVQVPSEVDTYNFPANHSLEESAVPATSVSTVDEETPVASPLNSRRFSWTAVIWVGGAISIVVRFLTRYASLVREIPLGHEPTKPQWIKEWDDAVREADISSNAHFRLSDSAGPLCCYVPFFFLVLAPKRLWETLEPTERRLILTHELAHVSRRDLWKSLAIRIIALPQWFNPVAWTAVRAFDEAAEWACDEVVMSKSDSESRGAYPAVLIRIAESEIEPYPVSAAVRGGTLTTRIRRLVQRRFTEESTMTKMLVPTLLCGLAFLQSIRLDAVADDVVARPPNQTRDSKAAPPPAIVWSNARLADGAVFGESAEFTFVGTDEQLPSGIGSEGKMVLPTIKQQKRAENVELHIHVVTDSNDNLTEFDALKNGKLLLANAQHFAANLRILKKNGLIRSETVPAISCKSGQRSSLEFEGIQVRVTPSFANDVHVTLKTEIASTNYNSLARSSNQTVALVRSDQAAVYRTGSSTYLVITPAFTNCARIAHEN